MKKGTIVKFKNPMADEIGLTFTIIEIDVNTNWCLLMANVNMAIKPTQVANISDIEIC